MFDFKLFAHAQKCAVFITKHYEDKAAVPVTILNTTKVSSMNLYSE